MSPPPIPLAPGTADETILQPARAGNPVLDWLNIEDSAGGMISHYRLMLDAPYWNWLASGPYTLVAELGYTGFLWAAAAGTAALQLVIRPELWLEPLSVLFDTVTAPLYAIAPPSLIVVAAFAILILQVFVVRAGPPQNATRPNKTPTLMDHWVPSSTQIARAQWDRLASGLVMLMLVWILTTNPFRLIQTLLEWIIGFGDLFTSAWTPGTDSAAYQSASTADLIRTTTFLINYREILDPDCTTQWASAINNYGSNPSCLTPSQTAATSTDLLTALLALAALPVGFYLAKFAFQVLIRFVNYTILAVAYLVYSGYLAAITLGRRRPYDPVVNALSAMATNAAMAAIVLLIAVAAPTAIFGLINGLVSMIPGFDNAIIGASIALLNVASVTYAYYLSGKLLARYMEIKEGLLAVFKNRIGNHKAITNLYDLKKGDSSLSGTALQPLSGAADWTQARYQQAGKWTKAQWDGLRTRVSRPAQKGDPVSGIVEETPEMAGAQQVFSFGNKPSTPQPDTPLDTQAARHRPATTSTTPPRPPVAINAAGHRLNSDAHPGDPNQTRQPVPVVVTRGGIPVVQLEPPAAAMNDRPNSATPSPIVTSSEGPAPTENRQRADLMQAHTAATSYIQKTGSASSDPTGEHQELNATTATYGAATTAHNTPAQASASKRRTQLLRGPNYTMLLSSAGWARALRHQRNLRAARGATSPARLSAEAEAAETLIFIEQNDQVRAVRKHDRGFGDGR